MPAASRLSTSGMVRAMGHNRRNRNGVDDLPRIDVEDGFGVAMLVMGSVMDVWRTAGEDAALKALGSRPGGEKAATVLFMADMLAEALQWMGVLDLAPGETTIDCLARLASSSTNPLGGELCRALYGPDADRGETITTFLRAHGEVSTGVIVLTFFRMVEAIGCLTNHHPGSMLARYMATKLSPAVA